MTLGRLTELVNQAQISLGFGTAPHEAFRCTLDVLLRAREKQVQVDWMGWSKLSHRVYRLVIWK